ncbi:hypothetical protein JXA84_07530, partial [candidate division WOR-3 bacterium]|nr:hypothetical protein [candidate division WOR-3 bacterium]
MKMSYRKYASFLLYLVFVIFGILCFLNNDVAVVSSLTLRSISFVIAFYSMSKTKWNWYLFVISLFLPFSSFFI